MDNPWKILSTIAFLEYLNHRKKEEPMTDKYIVYDDDYLDEHYEKECPYDDDFRDEIDKMIDEKLGDLDS